MSVGFNKQTAGTAAGTFAQMYAGSSSICLGYKIFTGTLRGLDGKDKPVTWQQKVGGVASMVAGAWLVTSPVLKAVGR